MAKSLEKAKAVQMRRRGMSVKEIAKALNIGRSTASVWLRDVVLTQAQKDRLFERMVKAGHRGRMRGAQMNREKKQQRIRAAQTKAVEQIPKLTARDVYMLGLGLYWGEGTKAQSSALSFVNSDPRAIDMAMRWFADSFGVSRDRFCPRIFINETHRSREAVLLDFWSKRLDLPKEQFAKTVFLKRENKKIYENHEVYYGILALRVSKGTNLRHEILASLERVADLLPG